MKKTFKIIFIIMGICFIGTNSFSTSEIKSTGILTSVDEDGSLIIDDKGYYVDPGVKIIDQQGKRSNLKDLSLPIKVDFEYIYKKDGFFIILIREIPKVVPQ